MHMKQVIQMQKLALLLALLAAPAISCCNAAAGAVRMQLTHADAGRGLTGREFLQRMVLRSKARAARFLSSSASAPVAPGQNENVVPDTEYLVHLAIGTPPQPVQLTLDTGSDLTWTQCLPCPDCFDQALPYFDWSGSSTFAVLPCASAPCQDLQSRSCGTQNFWGNQTCVYTYSYGDKSVTTGSLNVETFTFGAAGRASVVPGLAFGCGLFNNGVFKSNETGIVGFGRGGLSLPSQLKVDNFSYCFTTITGSKPSPVLLGLPADLHGNAQSTPFLPNTDSYYLSLEGITVGSTRLPVSAVSGKGGTIIDSGTSLTALPKDAFNQFCDAFVSQLNLPEDTNYSTSVGLPCFSTAPQTKPDVPKVMFHFEGATLDLPRENYIFEDAGSNVICLTIHKGNDTAIIGNYQQQNIHVLYDLASNMLSFVPAQCDKI